MNDTQHLSIKKDSFSGLLESLQSRAGLGYHDVAILFALPGTSDIKKIDLQLNEQKDSQQQDINNIITAAQNNLNEAEKALAIIGLATMTATDEEIDRGVATYGYYVCKNVRKKNGTIDAFPKLRAYGRNPVSGLTESIQLQVS